MKNKILKRDVAAIIAILVTLLFPVHQAAGENPVAEADSAYMAKEYTKAINMYEAIAETEGTSAALLFNLGNAYYQEGSYGEAMLCWLRAKRLDPGNREINSNIRYLRSRVEDSNKAELKGSRMKVTRDESSFFRNVYTSIAEETSSNTWAVLGAGFFILFVGGAALYIFTRNVLARKVGFFGGIICLAVSLTFVIYSIIGARAFSSKENGVITAFKVTLQTEPGKASENERGGVLTKGTEVQILSEETDAEGNVTWYKVRLNSDFIGWVAAEDLRLI